MRNSSKRRPSQIAELLRSGGGVRAVKHILCAALFAAAAVAQSSTGYRIDTVAGSRDLRDNGPAPAAWLRSPNGVALDGAGNLFIADTDNHRIRKVDSAGVITTVAGTGRFGLGGNFGDGGPATAALLRSPEGVALDGAGNLFIADTGNHRIRKVDSAGVISTVAGTGGFGLGGNFGDGGPAIQAAVFYPSDVAVDGAGNLFIAERFYDQIRKVDSAGGHHHRGGHGRVFRRVQRGRRPSDPGCCELPLWRGGGRGGQPLHRRYGQRPDTEGGLRGGHQHRGGHGESLSAGSAGTAVQRSRLL